MLLGRVSRCALAALFAVAAYAADPEVAAPPGTVNFTVGQVALNGRAIDPASLGWVGAGAGQTLRTESGKAELLLAPGVYLRLAGASEIKMISTSPEDVRLELVRGEALADAEQLDRHHRVAVIAGRTEFQIEQNGIYEFHSGDPEVLVFRGKAAAKGDNRTTVLRAGRELLLKENDRMESRKFDRREPDPLFAWNQARSGYINDAGQWTLETMGGTPDVQYSPGWHWSPWYMTWVYIPASMIT